MTRLIDIPIRVETAERAGDLGGGVAAVLTELTGLLEKLARGEEAAAIDLRSLPMSPDDRSELQRVLGQGEVEATLTAAGISTFRETHMSGVWWVTHCDVAGDIIAELIEVTRMPQILLSAREEITASAQTMRNRAGAPHETRQ